MKVRKIKELVNVLKKKGFEQHPQKNDHKFYYLTVGGKKTSIFTFFSHGKKEYGNSLMLKIKGQLRFQNTQTAEDFFDCPLSKEEYIKLLKDQGDIY